MAGLLGLLVGMVLQVRSDAEQTRRSTETIHSWIKAYANANGKTAKVWFKAEGTSDCLETLNRLGKTGYQFKVNDKELDELGLLLACRASDALAITYWR
ncbi:hypothetical protein [Pseudomonas amygdali]|nr:hypothetical protein [Pseudomonas amygdali]